MTDSEPLQLHAPSRPVVLLVLDGFGVNPDMSDSTWQSAKLPSFTEMERLYPFTTLQASRGAACPAGRGAGDVPPPAAHHRLHSRRNIFYKRGVARGRRKSKNGKRAFPCIGIIFF